MNPIYKYARRHLKLMEIAGARNNPLIVSMLQLDGVIEEGPNSWADNDEVPWCSAFVNWCAYWTGFERTKSLMARSWVTAGVKVSLKDARQGDVVILSRGKNPKFGHVGFYHEHSTINKRIALLGGNQSDSVNVSYYDINRVVAIRRLNYLV